MSKLESIIIESAMGSFTWVGEISWITKNGGRDLTRIQKAFNKMTKQGILTKQEGWDGRSDVYTLSDSVTAHFKLLGSKEGMRQLSQAF